MIISGWGSCVSETPPAGSTMVNRLGTATATELRLTAVMVIVPRKLGAGAGPQEGGGGTMTPAQGVSALLHMDIFGQRPLMILWFCQD